MLLHVPKNKIDAIAEKNIIELENGKCNKRQRI